VRELGRTWNLGTLWVYTMPMWCCNLCKVFWYARILFGMICGANWIRLEWVKCVISEGICISRSGEPIAILSVSLRRSGWVLSDIGSCSGEWGPPKRDSEGVAHVERDFSFRRGFCGFERTRVSPRRDGLAWARCLGHVLVLGCSLAQASPKLVFEREMVSPRRGDFA